MIRKKNDQGGFGAGHLVDVSDSVKSISYAELVHSREKVSRPALRYFGGKWRLAPWICSHFPEHRTYVELFGGGGSVLLRKPRVYGEVYNDLDSEIVNFFRICRDSYSELVHRLKFTPYSREEYELAWYSAQDDPLEQARRTVIKSFLSFGTNGIHKRSGFRARVFCSNSHSAMDFMSYADSLVRVASRLSGVVIENRPALELAEIHDTSETLFYVDPPYPLSSRGRSRRDYTYDMTDDHHRELAGLLKSLKGMVVVSGYPCPLYEELFPDWHRVQCDSFADGSRPRVECLWLNSSVVSALSADFFLGGVL